MSNSIVKTIELRLRSLFNGWVGRGNPDVVDAPQVCLPESATERILLLRQDRIGDVLVSIPILRALRRRFPSARIDMVLSANNMAVESAVRVYCNTIHVYRKGLAGLFALRNRLKKENYGVVVDLMDNPSSTSGMLVAGANSSYAVGIDKQNRAVYTHVVPLRSRSSVHIVERIANLLMPFGINPETTNLELEYPLQAANEQAARNRLGLGGKPAIGVNISGSDLSRMYPLDGVTSIAVYTRETFPECEVVILAAPQHRELQTSVAAASGCRAIEPSVKFDEWAATIAQLHAIITPDTSVVHLAAAFKIPSVVLFVHDNPNLLPWYPYKTRCEPVETTTSSIANITVDEVCAAVSRLLRSL